MYMLALHRYIHAAIVGPCTDTYMLPLLGLAQIHTCCHYWALHRYIHAAITGPCTDTYMLPLQGRIQDFRKGGVVN